MKGHIALLRAVNVGGKGKISSVELKLFFEQLGFPGAGTLLQSGNVVFDVVGRNGLRSQAATDSLEQLLEQESAVRLGLRTDYFVRKSDEWAQVIAYNPFEREAAQDPSHLVVMVLKNAPSPVEVDALRAAIKGPERVSAWDRHAYIVYPAGIGTSKLTIGVIEGKLHTRGTGRNWNTVQKLHALMDG
ncbi:MAG TPA: DUF1697 domain-containing protein [Spirochaetia bacterium]|nr:DUF1697 domain-containing protein [Spirochaetia bacterium]